VLVWLFAMTGCAAAPPRRIYELAGAASPQARSAAPAAPAAPVLHLAAVRVPDYLDSNDIVLRVGQHQLQTVSTARWGERLSAGLTHALASDLAERLPSIAVTADPSGDAAAARVFVSVETFDVWADGHCVLKASWTIVPSRQEDVPDHHEAVPRVGAGTFVSSPDATVTGDAAVVNGMAAAVEKLADSLAPAAAQMR
jgi:uncharacterized lipoprotein YmbA